MGNVGKHIFIFKAQLVWCAFDIRGWKENEPLLNVGPQQVCKNQDGLSGSDAISNLTVPTLVIMGGGPSELPSRLDQTFGSFDGF